MNKIKLALLALFLLSGCSASGAEAITGNSQQPEAVSQSAEELAQAESRTIQDITIQVVFRNPDEGVLVLPVTIVGPEEGVYWEPGEPVLKADGELIPVEELVWVSQLPSSDGGITGTANRFELRFVLSNVNSDSANLILEIPYVVSENTNDQEETTIIDGPWIFEIPETGY